MIAASKAWLMVINIFANGRNGHTPVNSGTRRPTKIFHMREDGGTSAHDPIGGLDDARPFVFFLDFFAKARMRILMGMWGAGLLGFIVFADALAAASYQLHSSLAWGCFAFVLCDAVVAFCINYVPLLLRPFWPLRTAFLIWGLLTSISLSIPVPQSLRLAANAILRFPFPVTCLRRGVSAWHL